MRENIVQLRGRLGELREELIEPEMTRIRLEEYHRRSLNFKATAEELAALLKEW